MPTNIRGTGRGRTRAWRKQAKALPGQPSNRTMKNMHMSMGLTKAGYADTYQSKDNGSKVVGHILKSCARGV